MAERIKIALGGASSLPKEAMAELVERLRGITGDPTLQESDIDLLVGDEALAFIKEQQALADFDIELVDEETALQYDSFDMMEIRWREFVDTPVDNLTMH